MALYSFKSSASLVRKSSSLVVSSPIIVCNSILVCAGDSEDVEKYPIIFEDSFDENEIYDLLRKNRKRIEEIIEREVAEAVPEGELSQPDDQAGSMADHFH